MRRIGTPLSARTLLVLWLALAGCSKSDGPTPGGPDVCTSHEECDDGLFCNGIERCNPSLADADAMGCAPGTTLPCLTGQLCNEALSRCDTDCSVAQDADGDGVDAVECGGTDCDDADGNRFPGNTEVCDAENHDEDCDPSTFGSTDADEDGAIAAGCCNEGPDGLICGNDCDDEDPGALPGAQVCDPQTDDGNDVLICRIDGTWTTSECFDDQLCITQPNGRGVCVP